MPGARTRRTWAQRAVIALMVVAFVSVSGTAATLAYLNQEVAGIDRVVLSHVLDDPEDGGELAAMNVLLVGLDDPTGLPPDDPAWVEHEETQNTDSMMILRIEPATREVKLLSMPRDLWVTVTGYPDGPTEARINSAFALGGAEALVSTVQDELGIPIQHYASVNFAEFKDVIGIIGGVPVQFPYPTRSDTMGILVPEPGCWVLNETQALNYARIRKDYEIQQPDGDWVVDPRSDYSRVERQQLLLQMALSAAIAGGARNPNTMSHLVDAGLEAVTVDDALSAEDAVRVGRRFRDFSPSEVQHFTLPTTEGGTSGPRAYALYLDEPKAAPVLAEFTDEVVAPDMSDTQVLVQNGSGTAGQAAAAVAALQTRDVDAQVDPTPVEVEETTIYFAPEQHSAATYLQSLVAGPVQLVEQGDALGSVTLVTGRDWAGFTGDPATTASTATSASDASASSLPPDTTTTTAIVEIDGADPTVDPFLPTAPAPGADCRPLP